MLPGIPQRRKGSKLNRFSKKIEDLLSAATFAEAGEFEAAKELAKGSRKVLVVLRGSLGDFKSFTYALSVAKRIGAGLEVLFFAGHKPGSNLLDYYWELMEQNHVEFHISMERGCIKTAILRRTTKSSNIQFVVAESIEAINDDCQEEDRSLRGALKKLSCPLVLVSEMEKA